MKRLIGVVAVVVIFLSSITFGSNIELIEPADAIRMIGDKRIIFVSGESGDAYNERHIIGSISMPASDLYQVGKSGDAYCAPLYRCTKEAEEYIRSKGIRNDQMIIAYDNLQGPAAVAVYSFFETLGHIDLKVLNGGLAGIQALDPNQQVLDKLEAERQAIAQQAKIENQEGRTDEEEELKAQEESIKAKIDFLESQLLIRSGEGEKHKASNYRLDTEKFNIDYIAEKREVENAVDDILKDGNKSKFIIVDMRCMDGMIVEEKMDSVEDKSRISGLKYIDWEDVTDFEKKKSFKSLEEMQKIFDNAGITRDKIIYVYCQNDTALGLYIVSALRLLGYKHVKIVMDGLAAAEII